MFVSIPGEYPGKQDDKRKHADTENPSQTVPGETERWQQPQACLIIPLEISTGMRVKRALYFGF